MERNDSTALLKLAQVHGDKEVVQFLSELGEDEKVRNPLTVASERGLLTICQKLHSDYGTDIEGDGDVEPPLLQAIKRGHIDVIKFLLQNGANFTGDGYMRLRPLVVAVESGHRNVVDMLLKYGAYHGMLDVQESIHYVSLTLLRVAAEIRDIAMVKFLDESGLLNIPALCNVSGENYDSTTALMYVAERGSFEILSYLLQHEINVNITDGKHVNALVYALRANHQDGRVIKLLLKKGIDTNVEPRYVSERAFPSFLAVERGWSVDVVKVLLDHGVDFSRQCPWMPHSESEAKKIKNYANPRYFLTDPLRQATLRGYTNVVKLLLAHGVPFYVNPDDKSHPANIAAGEGHIETLRVILDKGKIDVYIYGSYLMETAKANNRQEVIEELSKKLNSRNLKK